MFFTKKLENQIDELQMQLNQANEDKIKLDEEIKKLTNQYSIIIDIDKEVNQSKKELITSKIQLEELNTKYQGALIVYSELEKIIDLDKETIELGEYGLYQRKFNFDVSEAYKADLEKNYLTQSSAIKGDRAVVCPTEWTVSGSAVEGKKMISKYKKLMLYAFNGECDGLIAKVKWNNAEKTKERIKKSFEAINKLGVTQNVSITDTYLKLKLDELALTYEYELKKNEEKEEQKRIRDQMRQEEKAQKDLERARKEAEEEERRYQKAIEKVQKEFSGATPAEIELLNEQVKNLEEKLIEAQKNKERAISMAQLTKVGHIYVISNIGSFGEGVYKIGLTRRLEPLDRVYELGGASVPFHFDVHAIIYTENAPQLEYDLHKKFEDRRLNRINNRKEFFKVDLQEIEEYINEHTSAKLEFTKLAEASEYRQTLNYLQQLSQQKTPVEDVNKFPTSLL